MNVDFPAILVGATAVTGAIWGLDAALWAPRIAKGMETLNHNVLNGIGAMPPKGGRVDLSDADVLAAAAAGEITQGPEVIPDMSSKGRTA